MKSILTITLLLAGLIIQAQNVMKTSAGSTIRTTGGVTIVLSDMDLENDGTINQAPGEGGFKFTGTQSSAIKGNSMPVIGILEVNKTNGGKLSLNTNISINSSLNFISGQLDLNGNNILMNSSAMIAGESENNRIIGANGGFVEITQNMDAPLAVNAGNLGATLTSAANLGSVTIRRGHTPQSGTGLSGSIQRYYSIIPNNNSNLNATLRLKYFDVELNAQNESSLVVYQSANNGTDWSNLSKTIQNTNANYVEKAGLASLALQTLANNDVQLADGVTGLVFTGQRKKPTEVQLNWTSQTETNMSGYQVQRRLDNEVDFSDRTFVNTLAPNGNSNSPLSYQSIDANPYSGTSYYRLKIIDQSNNISYSNIISVAAKWKGKGGNNNNLIASDYEEMTTKPMNSSAYPATKKITIGPNPNNGNFWFSINGLDAETIATLYTIDGKLVDQFRVTNLQRQHVTTLRSGIYLLKVPGFETQKIIVTGGGSRAQQPVQIGTDNNKL